MLGVAPNMNTPDPDPGEEYPHINTQLFGIQDEAGIGKLEDVTTVEAGLALVVDAGGDPVRRWSRPGVEQFV